MGYRKVTTSSTVLAVCSGLLVVWLPAQDGEHTSSPSPSYQENPVAVGYSKVTTSSTVLAVCSGLLVVWLPAKYVRHSSSLPSLNKKTLWRWGTVYGDYQQYCTICM